MIGIGLGANLGNVKQSMDEAIQQIRPFVRDMVVSRYWKTTAFPDPLEPAFLNAALICRTDLTPYELLSELQGIEHELGRQKREKWSSREIDLDILFYDDQIIDTETLTIPHPYISVRDFVLYPLADIAPDWRHPVLHKTTRELLDALPADAVRTVIEPL